MPYAVPLAPELPWCSLRVRGEHPLTGTQPGRSIVARAPTRIDFGGGWTDVPPYSEREGGFVCNIAIDLRAVARLSTSAQTRASGVDASDAPLVRAAMRRTGVSGVRVSLENQFPTGAGLGGSSAASAALLGALAEWSGARWSRSEIAEEGRRIEVVDLGVAGGRQDHYAACHGGALALTFSDHVDVRRLHLNDHVRTQLQRRSLLVYTGQSRISAGTITAVLGAYEAGDARVVSALARMRSLAMDMATSLEAGDLDALGQQLDEHWTHQRSLHESIPTERIDEIVSRSRKAGAIGAKATGASGGGCVFILCKDDTADAVRAEVASLGEVLRFGFDADGLTVIADPGA
jgi:D-glycero-alpha-D-manno-heptose-7-phosphate kinase